MERVIHIVFSESTEGSFKHGINRKKSIAGDKIIVIYDNISHGRLSKLITIEDRADWLKELNEGDSYRYISTEHFKENYDKFYKDISEINETDTIYLWYGHCDREICGMLYTLYLLRNKQVNVYSVDVSATLIRNNQGAVWVNSASEINSEKLGEYFKLARKIERDECINLSEQWSNLIKENSILRSCIDGKMKSVSDDYFDKDILKFTDKEYKKAGRVMGDVILNVEPRVTDDYIFWRIKELIKSEKIKFKGDFNVLRKMDICITDKGLEYAGNFKDVINFWNQRKRAEAKKLEFIESIKEEGRVEERLRIANKLLNKLDVETIADVTSLSASQIVGLESKE
jgi:Protein of unknown function./Domain of unknown function (DUF1835).